MKICRARAGVALLGLVGLLAIAGCGKPTEKPPADQQMDVAGTATAGTPPDAPPPEPVGPPPADTADTIYQGGTILTMNDAQPTVDAVAVKDGRILAVGTSEAIDQHKGPATRVFDLAGRTLLPGFIDAHGHVSGVGLQAVAANLLPPPDGTTNSIEALQKTLRDWIAASAIPGDFGLIIGFGYDDSQLKEQRHPTRDDLDAVSKDLPVIAIHQSGHLGAYNSKALELAGITAKSRDPEGGVIRRRPGSREPNGVMEETAHQAVLMSLLPKLSETEQLALLEAGQNLYAKYGHTTAQDGRTIPAQIPIFIKAAEDGRLIMDVVAFPDIVMLTDDAVMSGPYVGREYKNGFRIGGVKLSLDGSPQGRTAWLTKPYFKAPPGRKRGYAGYPTLTDQQANAAVARAFKNNWQILVHSNGDAATDQLIRAVRAASAQYPGEDRRPVLIHGQVLRENQIDALRELGIFPSLFPMHTFYWGDWHRDTVLGRKRAENISPTGWFQKRGMMFTTHHDAPVAFPDTMRVLSATVNRTTRSGKVLGPKQRVEPLIALKAMTLWAAYELFEENNKGSIETGKVADFVVLSDNPLTVPRENLADIKVTETIKADKRIFSLEAAPEESVGLGCAESPACFERFAAFRADAGVYPEIGTPHRNF